MAKYATIHGFKSPAIEADFLEMMDDRIKNFDAWNIEAVKADLFNAVEESLNMGDDWADYELSKHKTISGHTENLRFLADDFDITWKNAD